MWTVEPISPDRATSTTRGCGGHSAAPAPTRRPAPVRIATPRTIRRPPSRSSTPGRLPIRGRRTFDFSKRGLTSSATRRRPIATPLEVAGLRHPAPARGEQRARHGLRRPSVRRPSRRPLGAPVLRHPAGILPRVPDRPDAAVASRDLRARPGAIRRRPRRPSRPPAASHRYLVPVSLLPPEPEYRRAARRGDAATDRDSDDSPWPGAPVPSRALFPAWLIAMARATRPPAERRPPPGILSAEYLPLRRRVPI